MLCRHDAVLIGIVDACSAHEAMALLGPAANGQIVRQIEDWSCMYAIFQAILNSIHNRCISNC